jgi:crotonobetaine/carnitine-CoA ligase
MDERTLENHLEQMGLIVDKMEEWAEKTPDKTFFYYGEQDRSYSYAEFNRMANRIGNHLHDMGVSKGDRVSLFLQNPFITILSMFGLWKIGAVFCPINFLYKGRLLSYQLEDTNPRCLITELSRVQTLNDVAADVPGMRIFIHSPDEVDHNYNPEHKSHELHKNFEQIPFSELLAGDDSSPGIHLNPWDTASIVYTSGTTGPPKGVVQSFRWLQNYCYYGVKMLHPEDVVFCDLPLYHIGGAYSLVGRAAWRGCTAAVWDRFSASDYWNRINKCGASVTLLLDVMMPWLLQPEESSEDSHNTLRRVHMQPLPEYHNLFAKRFGIDFVNVGYGATECGYVCAAIIDETTNGGGTPKGLVKGHSSDKIRSIAEDLGMPVVDGSKPIKKGFMGKACMFHQVSILGEHDETMERGEYGQIGLRSRLPYVLMNEYFNKPEATVEVFRNQWFHTGDGAYCDEQGCFFFVDRMGNFIRVRGENISSFQVEDLLNGHPKIGVSAAFPVPAGQGLEDDIVVYIVPVSGETLEEDELREWIETEMPGYMRPKHIRFIDALPQTPTHKVEKYKLRAMFEEEGLKVDS